MIGSVFDCWRSFVNWGRGKTEEGVPTKRICFSRIRFVKQVFKIPKGCFELPECSFLRKSTVSPSCEFLWKNRLE
ncbi:hypothetical protein TNCT_640061, partial [Trichonephila clavata]